MASKTCQAQAGQSYFFSSWKSFFLLVFGFTFWPLFDQVLDTFGCLFGCLLGAFSGLLRFSWEPLDPKTLKNCGFFKLFENAAFWLFEILMALLGSSCPLFGRSGPKMGPKMVSKNAQKRSRNKPCFFSVQIF